METQNHKSPDETIYSWQLEIVCPTLFKKYEQTPMINSDAVYEELLLDYKNMKGSDIYNSVQPGSEEYKKMKSLYYAYFELGMVD